MRPEVRLKGGSFDFSVPLGNGPATLSGGAPGWEELTRPGRVAMTVYQGQSLIHVDVPVLLDGWPHHPVEDDVEQILRICRGHDGNRPPDFTASGPIPYSGSRFVMDIPDWGVSLREEPNPRHTGGKLVRQELTLKLIQFVDPDNIRFRRKKGKGASQGGGTSAPPNSITLQRSETLLEVSARIYGTARFAGTIGKLNGIHDARKKLKAGTTLRLPPGWPGN